jgi:Leucine Rich repeat
MTEHLGLGLIVGGAALAAIGALWLLVRAFRQHLGWGLTVLLLPLVGALAFISSKHGKRARAPLALILFGAIVCAGTLVFYEFQNRFVPLGPWDKMEPVERDGKQLRERHLTLTGWDGKDYSPILKSQPPPAVIQMANPDVTDDTVALLVGNPNLHSLDLNRTQLTDDGLKHVKQISGLRVLRLAQTKITDDGFREHLMGMESLADLDLTGTAVAGKTKREWKAAKPDRRIID